MKIINILLLILLFNFKLWSQAYEDLSTVRALGMGEAFEAISDGLESIRYNPAGPAYLKSLQIYTGFGIPAAGFDDGASFNSLDFGIAIPFSNKPYLAFLNYLFKGLTFGNDNIIMQNGSFGFMFHQLSVSQFAYERLYTFNLAKSLNNLFEGANLALGVNLNIFNRGFTPNADTAAYPYPDLLNSKTGLGLDLGITYQFSRYINLGLAFANLVEPNISLFSDSTENVNRQMKLGLGWILGNILFTQDFLLSVSLNQISRDPGVTEAPETIYKVGIEFWEWKRQLAFRFGYESQPLDVFTAGMGFKYQLKNGHSFMINYAFNYPLQAVNYKNYFSLNYNFELPDYDFDYMTKKDILKANQEVQDNYKRGFVIIKYKTLANDNLYNISLINYGTPDKADLLKQYNKIEDVQKLPVIVDVPYDSKSFELYQVQPYDTVQSIAKRYYDSTNETGRILKFNKIEFSKLEIDRILLIPITAQEKEQIRLKHDAIDKLQKANLERNNDYDKLLTDLKTKIAAISVPITTAYTNTDSKIKNIDNETKSLEKKADREKDEAKKAEYGDTIMNLADSKSALIKDINTKIKTGNTQIDQVKQAILKNKVISDKKYNDVKVQNSAKAGKDFIEVQSNDLDQEIAQAKGPYEEIKTEAPKTKENLKPITKPVTPLTVTNKKITKPLTPLTVTNKKPLVVPKPKTTTVTNKKK